MCMPLRYCERLQLRAPVTLQPALGPQGGEVVVVWETSEPYQAVLEAGPAASGAVVRGLTLRHRSPSVANNYAVFLQVTTPSDASLPDQLPPAGSFTYHYMGDELKMCRECLCLLGSALIM